MYQIEWHSEGGWKPCFLSYTDLAEAEERAKKLLGQIRIREEGENSRVISRFSNGVMVLPLETFVVLFEAWSEEGVRYALFRIEVPTDSETALAMRRWHGLYPLESEAPPFLTGFVERNLSSEIVKTGPPIRVPDGATIVHLGYQRAI